MRSLLTLALLAPVAGWACDPTCTEKAIAACPLNKVCIGIEKGCTAEVVEGYMHAPKYVPPGWSMVCKISTTDPYPCLVNYHSLRNPKTGHSGPLLPRTPTEPKGE